MQAAADSKAKADEEVARAADLGERRRKAEAERIARKHLAATQSVLLERFTADVVRAARGATPHERRTC